MTFHSWITIPPLALACALTTGCRHRAQVAAMPPLTPPSSVPLVPAPEPATPPQVASVPVSPAPMPSRPVQPKAAKPRKKQPAVAPPPAPAPVEVASAAPPPPPPAAVIGALSEGGNAAPAEQQKAAEAITAVEKRLAELPSSTLDAQRDGITRVRNFLRQANDALKIGDADGAWTLATKARVLLDDLLK